jgi:hypothetical protein
MVVSDYGYIQGSNLKYQDSKYSNKEENIILFALPRFEPGPLDQMVHSYQLCYCDNQFEKDLFISIVLQLPQ